MPKLKDHTVNVHTKAGETVAVKFEITVSVGGEFRARVPVNHVEDLDFMACLRNAKGGAKVEKLRDHVYLVAHALPPLEAALQSAVEAYASPEETTERVILYRIRTRAKFAIKSDGTVSQNGHTAGGKFPDDYTWNEDHGGPFQQDLGVYMVGIWAQVYDKHIARRGDKEVIRYSWVGSRDGRAPAAERLNAFIECAYRIAPKGSGVQQRHVSNELTSSDYEEMPYTDEAADYFSGVMLSLCDLVRRVDHLFRNPERLAVAIQNRAGFLPAPPVRKEEAES